MSVGPPSFMWCFFESASFITSCDERERVSRRFIFMTTRTSESSMEKKKKKKNSTTDRHPITEPKVIGALLFSACFTYWISPPGATWEKDVKEHVYHLMGVLVAMVVFDKAVASRTKSPWLLIHAVMNLVIATLCVPDVIRVTDDPIRSCHGVCSKFPSLLIGALHIYHMVAFRTSSADWYIPLPSLPTRHQGSTLSRHDALSTDNDRFHHILFVGTLIPFGLLIPIGPITNLIAFFICGLPGGLDYVLLCLVKHDMIHKLTEKRWNARINVRLLSLSLCRRTFVVISYICLCTYGSRRISCRSGYVRPVAFRASLRFI